MNVVAITGLFAPGVTTIFIEARKERLRNSSISNLFRTYAPEHQWAMAAKKVESDSFPSITTGAVNAQLNQKEVADCNGNTALHSSRL